VSVPCLDTELRDVLFHCLLLHADPEQEQQQNQEEQKVLQALASHLCPTALVAVHGVASVHAAQRWTQALGPQAVGRPFSWHSDDDEMKSPLCVYRACLRQVS
jgi:hypothetical protein